MATIEESAAAIFATLADHYGQPESAPATDLGEFAAVVAAFLNRTLEPRRVAAALSALGMAGLLGSGELAEAVAGEVASTLITGGVRATPKLVASLQRLARWASERLEGAGEASTAGLREELLGLNGIGPPTADAILMQGLGRPVYPVDRASYRVAARHGWIEPLADYDEARAALERLAPGDPGALAALADWSERLGREFCRAGVPRCERCPLRPFLPEGGPRNPDE